MRKKRINPITMKREEPNLYDEILNFHDKFESLPPFSWMYRNYFGEKIDETPKCYCGNYLKFKSDRIQIYCSRKCMNNSPEVQSKRKMGLTKETINKRRMTNLEKYGGPAPISSNKIKEKIIVTNLKRYGTENPSQNEIVKLKKLKTMEKNYGSYYFQTEEFKNTRKKHFETNKHVNFKDCDVDFLKELYFNKNMTLMEISECIDNDLGANCIGSKLKEDGNSLRITVNRSSLERKICSELDNDYETNVRYYFDDKRKFHEIDILLPEQKLGIECNGMFWHSIEMKPKTYHLDKTSFFKENYNLDILHFWETEIKNKFDIVMSVINNKLNKNEKLYARKCEVKSISPKEAKIFCDANHIQGFVGAKIHLGLFYNNEIMSYMSFGKSRYNKNYEWELIRFCNKLNITMIGGANKLFKHFLNKNFPESVISYQDKRLFNGNLYEKLNFKYSHNSPPNYFYFGKLGIIKREMAQKHKLKDLLTNFDENLTEIENMTRNKYIQIYDCGTNVWTWKEGD